MRAATEKNPRNEVKLYVTKDRQTRCLNDLLVEEKLVQQDGAHDVNMNSLTQHNHGYLIDQTDEFTSNIEDLRQYFKMNFKNTESIDSTLNDDSNFERKSFENKLNLKSKPKHFDEGNIFVYGSKITPTQSLTRSNIHELVKEFLHLRGFNEINEYEAYLWPILLRGHHLLAVDSKTEKFAYSQANLKKDKYISVLAPLLSLLINDIEFMKTYDQNKEASSGVSKAKNGPILMIVCSSCSNAQRLFELVMEIMQPRINLIKVILLQGK